MALRWPAIITTANQTKRVETVTVNIWADNPFAGDAYKACRTNVSENFCQAFSEVGDGVVDILEPEYGEGDCPRDSSIGSCERGGWEEVYYEDSNQGPMGVKFGCNFAGDWIKPK